MKEKEGNIEKTNVDPKSLPEFEKSQRIKGFIFSKIFDFGEARFYEGYKQGVKDENSHFNDLLEACKEAIEGIETMLIGGGIKRAVIDKAKSAIAKAEGK